MEDGFFELDLLLEDGVWMSGVAVADPIDGEGWIALRRGVRDPRVHVTIVADGVAQAGPVEFVFCNTVHQELDGVVAASDAVLGLAVSGADLESTAGRYAWIDGICVTDNGLNECGEGTGVAVIQRGRDRDDWVGRCGCDGDD